MNTWYDEKYKYYINACYSNTYKTTDSNWNKHEFVSADSEHNIIGYIAYSVDHSENTVSNLCIINFSDNQITFGKDLVMVLTNIFEKFRFRKLSFAVIIGNPIERSYDKLIQKYGGKVVGVRKQEVKLMDGYYYDLKLYEIFREDYLTNNLLLNG